MSLETYYTVAQVAAKVQLHRKTVIEKMKAGDFGRGVLDLAAPGTNGKRHDYRIPASGVQAWLAGRCLFLEVVPTVAAPVFSGDEGIVARSEGELRRKASKRLEQEAA